MQIKRTEEEDRRLKLQEDKLKTQAQIDEEERKARSTDVKDVLARAQKYSRVAHTAKVNITHLKKESKNQ